MRNNSIQKDLGYFFRIVVGVLLFAVLFVNNANAALYAYVTNAGDDNVSVVDMANGNIAATINVGDFPIGVATNKDGTRVYVVNDGSGTVSIINTATNNTVNTVNIGDYPVDVAVGPDGTKVYVTNSVKC